MTKSEALGPLSSLVWGSGGPGLIGMSCQNRCLALYWEYPGQSPIAFRKAFTKPVQASEAAESG
ncbi:hypothetical protein LCI18_004751 [Fusarium solani-melongenae]|uniref:Uncharacterized protein n=1 Tax=Fusarium solani subsp. cucurbitae TaxID=2747967 RepID=A0ACD3YYX1_FUSSC|nr:hypothetical protein LCI18_004751 [Fusarium solani-melongenae]